MVLGRMVLGSMVLDHMVLDSMGHDHSIRSQLAMRTKLKLRILFSYKDSYLFIRVEYSLVSNLSLLPKPITGSVIKKGFTFLIRNRQ